MDDNSLEFREYFVENMAISQDAISKRNGYKLKNPSFLLDFSSFFDRIKCQ